MQNVGPTIKRAREDAGLSQRAFAKLAGVSFPSVARWETGKNNPSLECLHAMARALNVPLFSLVSPDTDTLCVVGEISNDPCANPFYQDEEQYIMPLPEGMFDVGTTGFDNGDTHLLIAQLLNPEVDDVVTGDRVVTHRAVRGGEILELWNVTIEDGGAIMLTSAQPPFDEDNYHYSIPLITRSVLTVWLVIGEWRTTRKRQHDESFR